MTFMLDDFLKNTNTLAIFGHVRPDGDCVGSTLALYNYILDNFPNIKVQVYLEKFPESYRILNGADKALPLFESSDGSEPFDATVLMDTPSFERVGAGGAACLQNAKKTCNIDHHISNPKSLCNLNVVEPSASSACEVLFEQLDPCKISKRTAECLYLGIVHDTGAFKFSNTGKRTMEIVGTLIDKGIDFARIVNETYYCRTYKQTLVTGFVLQNCKLALEGRVVHAYVTPEKMKEFDAAVWAHHGLFVSGPDFDTAFGLMHTIEKSAAIWVEAHSVGMPIRQTIEDADLIAIAEEFGVSLRRDFLGDA